MLNPSNAAVRGFGGALSNLHGALAETGSINAFRAATALPPEAQKMIDDAVVRVGLDRLVLVDDLISQGLVKPLPNWLAVPSIQQRKMGRAGHAHRSFTPGVRGERQTPDETSYTIPVTATWDDFSFGIREQMNSERVGAPLDTENISQAARNVNEAIEDQGVNSGITVDGNSQPGLLNAPDVNTYQYLGGATGLAWTDAAKTGAHILQDVGDMIDLLEGDNYFDRATLYVNTTYGRKISTEDYASEYPGTIKQRLEQVEVGGVPLRIRTADKLPANRTALVTMNTSVIDVVDGQRPTAINWLSPDGFTRFFMVLACQIVRPKSDADSQSGIVLGNTT